MKIIVPKRTQLDLDLPGAEIVQLSEFREVPKQHQDADVAILWGMQPAVKPFVESLKNVKWFQTLAAGPDGLLNSKLPDDVIVTNGLHFHDRPVAEHAVALTLALTNRIPESLQYQSRHEWSDMGIARPLHDGVHVRTAVDSNVVVWGFGAIGQQIGRLFQALGSHVTGIARSEGVRAGFPVVTQDSLPEVLADCDILVSVLPRTNETDRVFNAEVINMLPDRALFVNVGRGSTVDEAALVKALEEGRLGGAGLDVFQVEPLPEDSPLWEAPNTIITAHCAGGRPDGAEARIMHNFNAWKNGDIDSMIGVVRAPK